jgi:hypothetical protein
MKSRMKLALAAITLGHLACSSGGAAPRSSSSGDTSTSPPAPAASNDAATPSDDAANSASPDAGTPVDQTDASQNGIPAWSGFYAVTDVSTTTGVPANLILCNRDASYVNVQLGSVVYIGAYAQDVELSVYVAQANGVEAANSWQLLDENNIGSESSPPSIGEGPSQVETFDGQYLGSTFQYAITETPDIGKEDITITYSPTAAGLQIITVDEAGGQSTCLLTPTSNPSDAGVPPQAFGNTP